MKFTRSAFRKTAVATVALLGAAAALSGCSAQDAGSSDGTVAMTLWQNSTTGPGQEFWEKTITDFEAANPGVTIESQAIQNEDLDGKLQTALNSGDAPDVFLQRGGGKLAAMVAGGLVKDLTDGVSDQARSEIPEGSFLANTLDDKVWAMPVAVLPGGLFYSQDLFTEAGITSRAPERSRSRSARRTPGPPRTGSTSSPCASAARTPWPRRPTPRTSRTTAG
jgi:raffinose/stachyose/melibiose transport system substrate-binding protein